MLDALALSNSSMVERRLGLIRLNGDACSKRADPFIFSLDVRKTKLGLYCVELEAPMKMPL